MTLVGDNFSGSDYLNQLLGKNKPADKSKSSETNYFNQSSSFHNSLEDSSLSGLDNILGPANNADAYSSFNDPLAEYKDLFSQIDKDISDAKQTAKEVAETLKIQQAEAEKNKQSMQKAIDAVPVIRNAIKNGSAAEKKQAIDSIARMSPAERRNLEKAYALKNANGNPLALRKDLRESLSGDEKTRAFDLLNEGIENDPKMATVALFEAMNGREVDKRTVSTIVNNASSSQLKGIQDTYDKVMKKDGALSDLIASKFADNERTELLNNLA